MSTEGLGARLRQLFLQELDEHVREAQRELLALEREGPGADRAALLQSVFRRAHSLKGAAAAVSLPAVEGTCHRVEEVLAGARAGAPLQGEPLDAVIGAFDALAEAGARLREGASVDPVLRSPCDALDRALTAMRAPTPIDAPPPSEEPRVPSVAAPSLSVARVDPVVRVPGAQLDRLMSHLGEASVARQRLRTRAERVAAVREDVAALRATWARAARPLRGASAKGGIPARLLSTVEQTRTALRKIEQDVERLGVSLAQGHAALDQLARPLEEGIRALRLVPFAELEDSLARVVRDVARRAGKEAVLALEGREVSIDRAVLESLRDPMLHLVRNAVDHGLEGPEERRRLGKPTTGKVVVAAALNGGRVEISVVDDGRGLDLGAVRQQASRRGLPLGAEPSDLVALLFLPGFSTRRDVTEISGRGVGLDVVKARVEAMHGTVAATSEPGAGTAFTLRLPWSPFGLRALVVRAGGQHLAVVAASVTGLLRVTPADVVRIGPRAGIRHAESVLPLARLTAALGLPEATEATEAPSPKTPAIVVAGAAGEAVFLVDALVGEQDILVQSLGPRLTAVPHFAGASVLEDGSIALVLSAGDLVRSALASPHEAPFLAPKPARAALRVVLADDTATRRALVKAALERAGYSVTAASDGLEAWAQLSRAGADALVTDVEMPRMDGFTLTERVRASKALRELPIVLLSGLTSEQAKARGAAAGADAYVSASALQPERLLAVLDDLLGGSP